MVAVDLQAVHDFLIQIAHEAGTMILTAKPVAAGSGTKKNSADLVSETDQAVEKMVSTRLKAKYPDFECDILLSFMGEETYKDGDTLAADTPTFIVDPIDGTTNFFHAHPYLCVSLGLAIARQPVVGVVFNPFTRTLYTAIKGQGAHLTDPWHEHARLPLRAPEALRDLSTCLVAVEWGAEREGNDYEVKAATFRKLCLRKEEGGAMVHGIRSLGSAELNLCGVAAGWLDVYWEAGCYAWDVCAGWVVLEEAGGRMVGCHEGDWEPRVEQRRYLAVRGGEGQRGVIEEMWGCVQGRIEVGFDAVS
ncbi:hypothetical protein LTR02_008196 [Friedmanniomyces endolithicus]|nr:hypothetical protein LTR94_008612 [Friedmanniomyces endolithicus]KAK0791238.1 hypothetical protein LTR59_008963 [Friedmanniomyces endolithicus]KAK0797499.1 hypothetical protein LTR38_008202 [Friedmanniomyces endolithicus]KAK0816287.1 hypothetical protein LTR75_003511 [Friedmanniomyces endolithicus]KAK0863444.1 hypothetical protein LTR87_016190 [Friedmanniomyces endolithicus]